jgi:hypothetical protein
MGESESNRGTAAGAASSAIGDRRLDQGMTNAQLRLWSRTVPMPISDTHAR